MLASTAIMSAGNSTGGRMTEGAKNIWKAPADIREGYQSAGKPEHNHQEQKLKS
jgi:hypothetical protein